jgi:hypothetical protein
MRNKEKYGPLPPAEDRAEDILLSFGGVEAEFPGVGSIDIVNGNKYLVTRVGTTTISDQTVVEEYGRHTA